MRFFVSAMAIAVAGFVFPHQHCSAGVIFTFNSTVTSSDFSGITPGSTFEFSFATSDNFASNAETGTFGIFGDEPGNLLATSLSGTGLTGAILESSLDGALASRKDVTGLAGTFTADDFVNMGFSLDGTPLFFLNFDFFAAGLVNPFVTGATIEDTFNLGTFTATSGGVSIGGGGKILAADMNSVTISSSTAAVPEPSSLLCLASASTIWLLKRRSKRRNEAVGQE